MTNKKKECLGNNKIQNVGKTKLLQLSVYFITVYSTSRNIFVGFLFWGFLRLQLTSNTVYIHINT